MYAWALLQIVVSVGSRSRADRVIQKLRLFLTWCGPGVFRIPAMTLLPVSVVQEFQSIEKLICIGFPNGLSLSIIMAGAGGDFQNPLRKFKLVFLGEQSGASTPIPSTPDLSHTPGGC